MTRKPIDPQAPPTLSPQQHTALWLMAGGLPIKTIGTLMGISYNTAKEHLHRAYRALHVRNATHAVHVAYQLGFFEVPPLARAEIERLKGKLDLSEKRVAELEARINELGQLTVETGKRFAAQDAEAALPEDTSEALALLSISGVKLEPLAPEFVGAVLDGHPEIAEVARDVGWWDPRVRDLLTEAALGDMLGLSPSNVRRQLTAGRGDELASAFRRASEVWG